MRINTSYVQSFYTGDTKFWNTIWSKTDENEHLTVKMISILRLNLSNLIKDSYLILQIHFRMGVHKLNDNSDKYVQFKISYHYDYSIHIPKTLA